jgi:methyl-accepting chemotaxis protein
MRLSKQLGILITFSAAGLIILGALALTTLRENLIDSRKHEIEKILTFAKNQATHFVELEKAGKITTPEAEKAVIDALSTMREGASFIWSNDNNAISRVHVRESELGKFQESYKDHMKQLASTDLVFKVSPSKKPGTDDRVIKVNGMSKIPGWNWVIGYGVYMDDLQSTFWQTAVYFIIAGFVILAFIIAAAIYLARNILNKIGGEPQYAMEVTTQIANGYLNESIQGNFSKDSLLGSIARMQNSLQEMVRNINKGSLLLTGSTKILNEQMQHIAMASQKSSDASYSTASAIQELSSCIDEISRSAHNTEKNSEESSALSLRGEDLVKKSAQSINEISNQITRSTEEIASLEKRSLQIGNIVNVIRDIAEQTNLLALNAAIEAARAGEQGRGFAVVADEVRTLASRTATATAEITETINMVQAETVNVAKTMQAILPKVEDSVESSNQVTKMLTNIRKGSDETLSRIRDVSHSAKEQNQATQSLAEHVEEISSMVQETATAVSSSRKSMDDLEKLAIELHESVSYFKI